VYEKYNYVIDPHGAVGFLASEAWLADHAEDTAVILETAHPSKFPETVSEELGESALSTPERLACLANEVKVAIPMSSDPQLLMQWLKAH
jgi:threonine synthase